jgi:hypothetical protein
MCAPFLAPNSNECAMTTTEISNTGFLRKMTDGAWPWFLVNVVGMMAFIFVSLLVMPTATTEGPVFTFGDFLVLSMMVMPVMAAAVFVNFIWMIVIVWKRKWHVGCAWVLNLLIWIGLMYFDLNFIHQSIDL